MVRLGFLRGRSSLPLSGTSNVDGVAPPLSDILADSSLQPARGLRRHSARQQPPRRAQLAVDTTL